MQGRPRPVVIARPEDMLDDVATVADAPTVVPAAPAPLPDDIARFETLLAQAARPIFIVGGSRWTPEARDALIAFAERLDGSVAAEFLRAIGRASSRARVCRNVLSQVGDEPVKKSINKSHYMTTRR